MPLRRVVLPCLVLLALVTGATASAAAPRIVGGQVATLEYPAQAEILFQEGAGTYLCGGTLIDPQWILTAAHCATYDHQTKGLPASAFLVRLGTDTLDTGGTTHLVDQVRVQPAFNPFSLNADAALLHLTTEATQTPLPVSPDAPAAGTLARVIGWGTTTDGGVISQQLQEVDVPIVSDSDCAGSYGSGYIAATMLCAGYPAGGKDACQGDSGGPLMVPTSDVSKPWTLVGIVSWGAGCAQANAFGVYTRVANTSIQRWLTDTLAAGAPSATVAATPTPTSTPTPVPTPVPTPIATPTATPAVVVPTPTPVPRQAKVTLPSRCRRGRCSITVDLPAGGAVTAKLTVSRKMARKLHVKRTLASRATSFMSAHRGTVRLTLPKATRKRLRGRVRATLTVSSPAGKRTKTVVVTR